MPDFTKLSRSRLELFLECRRCFWLLMNKKIKRPPGFPFTLNIAVDYLLKEEFDKHREEGTAHALIKKYEIDAIPFSHTDIDKWRHNFTGVQFSHDSSGFLVFGAVDDVWKDSKSNLMVVDYKATGAKEHRIYDAYKRQMEVYQWLLKKNGFSVSNLGYFLFAKVDKKKQFKGARLSFKLLIEPCSGNSEWVENELLNARKCLEGKLPEFGNECKYCNWCLAQSSL
jgi:hypothetical protein